MEPKRDVAVNVRVFQELDRMNLWLSVEAFSLDQLSLAF